ncbi:hypothetical protein LMG24238_03475 [Paraburkholderia sediminicola]|uniref:Uncharacterized protein n=1 Tax=Paraburkholderia sediminicola TaxID=458836 RepID=A0A6J5BA29_9BURK|nr:hypothetical protein [Paraburkholderia sediminicola]CAB3698014.1 hypothetical protein LMG24238_03475 [Paraburkholderia sediminicola]
MKTIRKLAAARLDRNTTAHGAVLSYQRLVAGPRSLFAAPPVDLLTLVIAEAVKRKAQPEIQRDALRDAIHEMPPSPERGYERGVDVDPAGPDDYI